MNNRKKMWERIRIPILIGRSAKEQGGGADGSGDGTPPPTKSFLRSALKFIRYTVIFVIVSGILGSLTLVGMIFYLSKQLPSDDELHNYTYNVPTTIYDRNGKQVGLLGTFKREPVTLDRINTCLVNATIAIEDERFYEHQGFDLRAMLRAAKADIIAGSVVEGASTLDQQVARNLFLTREQTIVRKLKEIIIAYRMGKVLSKDEIITLYLNVVPYGRGAYGVQAAAENYYGKDNMELTISECATIAGLPQAPSYIAPHLSIERATARRNRVLTRMLADEYITQEEYSEAVSTEIRITDTVEPRRKYANYFVDYVVTELKRVANITDYLDNGYTVYTTLNLTLQEQAEDAVELNLIDIAKRQGFAGELSRFSYTDATEEIATLLNETKANEGSDGEETMPEMDLASMTLRDKDRFETQLNSGEVPSIDTYTDQYVKLASKLYYEQMVDVPSYLKKRGVEKGLVISINRTYARVLLLNNDTLALLVSPYVSRNTKMKTLRENSSLIPFKNTRWASNITDKIAGKPSNVVSMLQVLENQDVIYVTPSDNLYDPEDENSKHLAYLFQEPTAESAMLSMNKKNEIVAMVGGFNYYKSVYNRAYQSYRQMGSSFKPIVYATAIENGYAFSDYVNDIPIIKEGQNNTTWKPSNYNEIFYGTTTFAEGLAKSRNTVTILLAEKLGLTKILDMVKRFRFSSEMPNDLTVSIGAGSASLMEVASEFNVFNNLGVYQSPVAIIEVWDANGTLVYSVEDNHAGDVTADAGNTVAGDAVAGDAGNTVAGDAGDVVAGDAVAGDAGNTVASDAVAGDAGNTVAGDAGNTVASDAVAGDAGNTVAGNPNRILTQEQAYTVLSTLEDVVNKGTAISLRSIGRPLAAKTGTTNDYRDAWFIGMFPNLLTVTWVGFDNFTSLGNAEYGARAAMPAWRRYTKNILGDLPYALFDLPENTAGVRYYKVDSNDYSISDSLVDDYFFSPFILDEQGKPIRMYNDAN